ncbi:efflux RND transporter periplasmic adaptor subunit [Parvicella tangerina]|uniref:Multidrug resistance protein MdtA-like barrel-sandwich hybrid domain-containing protein n=1 Tax=Parvicella tangerina TaxID=2829795 RepID=A0A916JM29_9FLAO|nr:HlyD family efflux transporter periplasmic adaptor subunit [Parvicella tangerina]CAG5080300.1 hypothetical protein CRYO30217_01250 [Parvicella tangerina]
MKVRHVLIIITSLLIVALIGIAFMAGRMAGMNYGVEHAEEIREERELEAKENSDVEVDSNIVYVKASPVENVQRPITANGFGQVNSSSMINITAEVQGEINAHVLLKKGTSFKKGQLLFTIKNDDVKMALKARKSAYLMLLTNILPDLKLDYADNFDAWLSFFNKIDVEKKLPPLPETKTFKEKNFIVSKSVLTEYYSIQSDEERLKKYTITAPFTGSILNTFTDDGAIINPGSPVVAVLREGNMEIEVPIANDDIDRVEIGAEVLLSDENGGGATGKVVRKGAYVNANTQTVPVFIEILDAEIPIYNGMYLDANIACEGVENIVELPRKALFNKNEVYTVVDGKLKIRSLNIKMFLEETVLVKDLPNGTTVVMEPLINAKEGLEVEVLKKAKP